MVNYTKWMKRSEGRVSKIRKREAEEDVKQLNMSNKVISQMWAIKEFHGVFFYHYSSFAQK